MPTNPAHHPNSPLAKESGPPFTTGQVGAILEAVTFRSILFDVLNSEGHLEEQETPAIFLDLNLDQIVDTVTAGREEYHLKPFFYCPLERLETVRYRQAVFHDLEDQNLLQVVRSFAEEMRNMRVHLARSEKHYYKLQKQASFLDTVETYSKATVTLTQGLASALPVSRGFQGLSDFLVGYCASDEFTILKGETEKIRADLQEVRYSLHINGARVTVDRNDRNGDYSQEVLETFQKFRQADPRSHQLKMPLSIEMNHIEAQILDLVAKLHAGIFAHLDEYCTRYRGHRGRMEIEVHLRGRSCHASAPERGDNPIYKMVPLIAQIEELNTRLRDDAFLGKGTIAVTEIRSMSPSLEPPDLPAESA